MKRVQYFFALFLLLPSQIVTASSGLLFNVTATGGAPTPLQFSLCLNGKGPLSCQTYNVNYLNLSITTTIPNHISRYKDQYARL